MYKVVTKIIVGRIRPLLAGLVSTLQIAFVLGRKGVDIAIIAQELIHSMLKKKDRVGVMAIKIDLEKAYDRIEWSFIRDTLALFKFPKHLISLIMNCVSSQSIFVLFNRGALISLIINCVSSSSISVLFNGGALKPFLPSRGSLLTCSYYAWKSLYPLLLKNAKLTFGIQLLALDGVFPSLISFLQMILCYFLRQIGRIAWL